MAGEMYGGGVAKRPQRIQQGKVFMGAHGRDTIVSVSANPANRAGFPRIEIVEGQVMTWAYDVQRWEPLVIDAATAIVSTSKVIPVSEPRRFTVGDLVHIEGVGYRTITARGETTITVDGANLSLAAGDLLVVDGGLSRGTVASISGSDVVLNEVTTGFKVGQRLSIGDGATIYAFTPTVADSTAYAIAARFLATGEVINVPITSGVGASAQSIVEALKAAGDGIAAFAAAVTLTEDNAKLYARFDPAVVDVYALTSNLARANASRTGIIETINNGTKTITLADVTPLGVSASDVVVAEEVDRHYRIAYETVVTANLAGGYNVPNIDVPTQEHGEVRERLVNGLTARARAYLAAGGIRFNNTAF